MTFILAHGILRAGLKQYLKKLEYIVDIYIVDGSTLDEEIKKIRAKQ